MREILLSLCVMFAATNHAAAIPVIDQANDTNKSGTTLVATFAGFISPGDRANTFTVGISGLLTQVDLEIQRNAAATDDLLVEIRATTAGAPVDDSGSILSSATVPFASIPTTAGFFSVDIPDVAVSVGQVLAIVVQSNTGIAAPYVLGTNSGQYPGGAVYLRNGDSPGAWSAGTTDVDFMFRTYVEANNTGSTIPEPATAMLALLAMMGVAARRGNRMRRGAHPQE